MNVVAPQAPLLRAVPAEMDVEQVTGSKIPLEIEVAQKQTSAKASQVGLADSQAAQRLL